MKTFKEFLLEELVPKVYRNIHPSALLNIVKQHVNTRFVIDGDGLAHAGNAGEFIHDDLYKPGDYRRNISGVISFDKASGKHTFGVDMKKDHPFLGALEKRGAERGHIEGDWGDIHAASGPPPERKYRGRPIERKSTPTSQRPMRGANSPNVKFVNVG